ncbi:GDP-fucose transporter 1-like [Saccostrea echinata]|uniref:GDP-fucose transporter 1-like n=1 Tax=Saccostrea echinata TaxID=191078 RepID=UPI002A818722|nr:GDP-fucose transporter 1-like [Saccostrea echinata]
MDIQSPFLHVAAIILLYWTVSISMVFVNKHILSGAYGDTDLSIFIAWYQSLAAVTIIQLIGCMRKFCRKCFKVPEIDFQTLFHGDIIKLSLTFIMSITLNNLMLKHIGVAFYQVARSFTLIFTIILSSSMLKQPLTWKALLACLCIITGFVIGIDQENDTGTLSVWGIIYGLMASFSAAICGVYFKQAERVLEGDSLRQAYYNNINCFFLLSPLIYSTGQARQVIQSEMSLSMDFWILLTLSGVLSLAIGWVSALQIKVTSPVSHHISINAKSVTQTIIAIIYYKEQKTVLWWCGNILVICGVLLYTLMKTNKQATQKSNSSSLSLLTSA